MLFSVTKGAPSSSSQPAASSGGSSSSSEPAKTDAATTAPGKTETGTSVPSDPEAAKVVVTAQCVKDGVSPTVLHRGELPEAKA